MANPIATNFTPHPLYNPQTNPFALAAQPLHNTPAPLFPPLAQSPLPYSPQMQPLSPPNFPFMTNHVPNYPPQIQPLAPHQTNVPFMTNHVPNYPPQVQPLAPHQTNVPPLTHFLPNYPPQVPPLAPLQTNIPQMTNLPNYPQAPYPAHVYTLMAQPMNPIGQPLPYQTVVHYQPQQNPQMIQILPALGHPMPQQPNPVPLAQPSLPLPNIPRQPQEEIHIPEEIPGLNDGEQDRQEEVPILEENPALNEVEQDRMDLARSPTHQKTLEIGNRANEIIEKQGDITNPAKMRVFNPMLGTLAIGGLHILNSYHWSTIASHSVIEKFIHGYQLSHSGRNLLLLGLANAIGLFVSAYFIRAANKEWNALKVHEQDFEDLVETWNANRSIYTPEYQGVVNDVNQQISHLLHSIKKDKITEIAFLYLGALSHAFLAVGSLAGLPLLINAGAGSGIAIAIVSTIISIFKRRAQPRAKMVDDLENALRIQARTPLIVG